MSLEQIKQILLMLIVIIVIFVDSNAGLAFNFKINSVCYIHVTQAKVELATIIYLQWIS